jgi:hypothetical protein
LNTFCFDTESRKDFLRDSVNPYNIQYVTFISSFLVMFILLYYAKVHTAILLGGCLFVVLLFIFFIKTLINSKIKLLNSFRIRINENGLELFYSDDAIIINSDDIIEVIKDNFGEMTIKTKENSYSFFYKYIEKKELFLEELSSLINIIEIKKNGFISIFMNYLFDNSTFLILVFILGRTGPALVYLIACMGYILSYVFEIFMYLIKKEFKKIYSILVIVRGVYGILVLRVLLNYFLK